MKTFLKSTNLLLASAALVMSLACGGGGGGDDDTSTPTNLAVNYSDPSSTGAAAIIKLNRTLSSGGLLVFEVEANKADTQIGGVNLNLQVDATKLAVAEIPGTRDAEVEHILATPTATPGTLSTGTAMRKDRADGYTMMVSAIRRPSPSVPGTGVILRFAYKVQGNPVEGVIRTQVMDGSGLLDPKGNLIPGTAPVVGRLEYVRK